MQLAIAALVAFGLRICFKYIATSELEARVHAVLLGIWEGVCLQHLTSASPSSYDPHLSLLLRLILDLVVTETIWKPVTILLWAVLTILIISALSSRSGYDTLKEKEKHRGRSHRIRRTSASNHLVQHISPKPSSTPVNPLSYSTSAITRTAASAASAPAPSHSPAPAPIHPERPSLSLTIPQRSTIIIPPTILPSPPSTFLAASSKTSSESSSPVSENILPTPPATASLTEDHETSIHITQEHTSTQHTLSPVPEEMTIRADSSPRTIVPLPIPAPCVPTFTPDGIGVNTSHVIISPSLYMPKNTPDDRPPSPTKSVSIASDGDELRTPLPGLSHLPITDENDLLLTPPALRALADTQHSYLLDQLPSIPLLLSLPSPDREQSPANNGDVIPMPGHLKNTETMQQLKEIDEMTTIDIESANHTQGNVTPIPIPIPVSTSHAEIIPELIDGVDYLSDVPSPISIISSGLDATTVRRRAEKLRQQAFGEKTKFMKLQEQLDAARRENNPRQIYLLEADIKDTKTEIDLLHQRAAKRYFHAGNRNKPSDVIDVHGLFIDEALEKTESALIAVLKSGKSTLRVITGKGLHSKGGIPKLKPEIISRMKSKGMRCETEKMNEGMVIITCP